MCLYVLDGVLSIHRYVFSLSKAAFKSTFFYSLQLASTVHTAPILKCAVHSMYMYIVHTCTMGTLDPPTCTACNIRLTEVAPILKCTVALYTVRACSTCNMGTLDPPTVQYPLQHLDIPYPTWALSIHRYVSFLMYMYVYMYSTYCTVCTWIACTRFLCT